ncbi:MAG: ribosome rescue GTPase HflX [Dokdonella sp.]|uniref:ribosome rescue GTPase HflX n=2 Tax=Dokdonella sp. TaxID=2291710 RepID=UPI002BB9E951|nr:GTPase HflX [Xanthomonadales bacterium]HQV73352.1 GTPase HflX [Dokdonella sp.]HQX66221.1 GTPase HflX [Dokdonella sp.]
MFDRSKKGERALLLQAQAPGQHDAALLEEFAELARSAGATVVGNLAARLDRPNPRYFVGTGKAEELKALRVALDADLILVNHALSPVQERNLEKLTECRVVDRTGLILDIFAQRARSHEGKLQVELAQLKHMSTRLVRGWTHLERQRGGAIGLRGPGETQLEIDRRLLAVRVKQLQKRLDKVEVQRNQARRSRERSALPVVALVGYTNAGKSTLFNAMTGAGVYAADQLFATLDPTLRRIDGLACGPIVLADTVGFIRELPHDLVAAFRSTLAEAREADLLLHVIDASDPERDTRVADVEGVLAEIGASDLPQVLVYNKIDRLESDVPRVDHPDRDGPLRVWTSARDGIGIDALLAAISQALARERVHQVLEVPAASGRLRARLHELGLVASEQPGEEGWRIEIDAPRARIEPLFGMQGGQGEWLKAALLAPNEGATYNQFDNPQP